MQHNKALWWAGMLPEFSKCTALLVLLIYTRSSSFAGTSSLQRYSGAEPEYMGSMTTPDVVPSVVGNSVLCAVVVGMSLFRSNSEFLLLLLRSQVCIFSSWFWPCEECTLADVCTIYNKYIIQYTEIRNFQTICWEIQQNQVVNLTHKNDTSFLYRSANERLDHCPKATSNMLQSISTLNLKMTNAVDMMQVYYQQVLRTSFLK